jgi:hypothetical protein
MFAVFKVTLLERADYIAPNVRNTRHTSSIDTLKEKY